MIPVIPMTSVQPVATAVSTMKFTLGAGGQPAHRVSAIVVVLVMRISAVEMLMCAASEPGAASVRRRVLAERRPHCAERQHSDEHYNAPANPICPDSHVYILSAAGEAAI